MKNIKYIFTIILLSGVSILASDHTLLCYKHGEINLSIKKTNISTNKHISSNKWAKYPEFSIVFNSKKDAVYYVIYQDGKPKNQFKLTVLPIENKNLMIMGKSTTLAKDSSPLSYEYIILNLKTKYAQVQSIPSMFTTINKCVLKR